MAIEECRHCINVVMFNEDGGCPICKKSKNESPEKPRERILYDREKSESLEKIAFLKKRGLALIAGGFLLSMLFMLAVAFAQMYRVSFLWLGLLGCFTMISKGFKDTRNRKEIALAFRMKYNEKLV